MDDFTMDELAELNRRYGSPLDSSGLSRLYNPAGGHPYLSQVALYKVSLGLSLDRLESPAVGGEAEIGDHLRRMTTLISQDPELLSATMAVLRGEPCPSTGTFYRLRAAGVLAGDSFRNAKPRCRLYADQLEHQLS